MTEARLEAAELDSALPVIQALTRVHDYVAVFHADDSVAWVSDSLGAACGAKSIKGRCWYEDLVEAKTGRSVSKRLARAGRVSNEPVVLRGHQGAIPATVSASRLGRDGACGATVAIFRIEAPRSLDSEFHHTLDYLKSILDSAPEGVVVVDNSRFITYANPAMCEMTGLQRDELEDKPLVLFMHAQADIDRIASALGREYRTDLEFRLRDGRPLRVNVTVKPLELPDGTRMGAVAYVRDVTELRRAEEELARKNAELEHYAHAVSHDLRSPLVAVLGFSRLLREDFDDALGEKGGHFLRRIEEAGRTMELLIHDLLELSRIGKTEPHLGTIDPREVLLQLKAELKPRLDEAGIGLELPAVTPLVLCDRTHFYRIASNLIGNAIDHMGESGDAQIDVRFDETPAGPRMAVCDNGRGIAAEDQERIFEIFQSLGPKNGHSGSGIGLAVVRRIAETLGGQAWVESAPGEGAAFYVTLPAA